jgi:hypothetical protein
MAVTKSFQTKHFQREINEWIIHLTQLLARWLGSKTLCLTLESILKESVVGSIQ